MQYVMYVFVNYGTHAASEGHGLHYFLQSSIYICNSRYKRFPTLDITQHLYEHTYIVLTFIRCRFGTFVR